jgi:recombinational DNA repair protein RecR
MELTGDEFMALVAKPMLEETEAARECSKNTWFCKQCNTVNNKMSQNCRLCDSARRES